MMQRNIVVIKVNKIEDLLKISLKSRDILAIYIYFQDQGFLILWIDSAETRSCSGKSFNEIR